MRAQTRHQLKQDRFSRVTLDAAEKTVDWTVEHQNKLIVAGIILLIVVGGVFGGWYYLKQQDLKASALLGEAVRTLETPLRPAGVPAEPNFPSFGSLKERAEAAQKQFRQVTDQYPHTRSADMARYFVAMTSAQLGDNAAAERDLKQVISNSHEDLASLAKLALASVYRDTNRTKDAIDIYNQLINKPTHAVGKVMAQLELAATYQDANQPDEAKRIYEQIQKENPSTDAAQIASTRLQALK